MYFKLLLLFTVINFVRVIIRFTKEHPYTSDTADGSTTAYIGLGFSAVFHLMVLGICIIPAVL